MNTQTQEVSEAGQSSKWIAEFVKDDDVISLHYKGRQIIKSVKEIVEALAQPAQDDDLMTGTWIRYNDGDDNKRLALELDIAMNGVDGAAKSPALIDVLAQAVDYFKNAKTYHVLPINDIKEHEESAYCDCYPRIEPHGLNKVVIHNSFDSREALAQPAQEPVAYIHRNEWNEYRLEPMDDFNITTIPWNVDILLYTHPAPSWQGLSDDEITELLVSKGETSMKYVEFARAIEQALKEKNHG